MIDPKALAGAARVAQVQPYPTLLIVQEHGVMIGARQGDLVCHHLVPWIQLTDAQMDVFGPAFHSVRSAMKAGQADRERALRDVGAT
jgi:hypothetical protein